MARETFGRAGLSLAVPGTKERYSDQIEIENLKKLSAQLDSMNNKVDELYSRNWIGHTSPGESTTSLGSAKSGWKIDWWSFYCRGFGAQLRVILVRTGNDIPSGSTGDIGNTVTVNIQPRFRPAAPVGAYTLLTGRLLSAQLYDTGDLVISATVPNRGIHKNERISLGANYLMSSPGLA